MSYLCGHFHRALALDQCYEPPHMIGVKVLLRGGGFLGRHPPWLPRGGGSFRGGIVRRRFVGLHTIRHMGCLKTVGLGRGLLVGWRCIRFHRSMPIRYTASFCHWPLGCRFSIVVAPFSLGPLHLLGYLQLFCNRAKA